jgi:hypothetical protein
MGMVIAFLGLGIIAAVGFAETAQPNQAAQELETRSYLLQGGVLRQGTKPMTTTSCFLSARL